MSTKSVRIGNAGGYWGDDPEALRRQLEPGNLDYITQDFLAEITMSILQKQRRRNPELGYAADFVDQIRDCLPLLAKTDTRIVSNAGGINPEGCAREIDKHAGQAGLKLDIAVVRGDDLMDRLDQLADPPDGLRNMETHEEFAAIRGRVLSANAYLGAAPVVEALALGARIVVTGRVTDTGITAAPPVHEFGWKLTDWDRLASAVVAGHIIECGAQASGGNLTDWEEVPSFQEMAFPIVEIFADGRLRVTKHPSQGGRVNRKTVTSQLIYEMGIRRAISPLTWWPIFQASAFVNRIRTKFGSIEFGVGPRRIFLRYRSPIRPATRPTARYWSARPKPFAKDGGSPTFSGSASTFRRKKPEPSWSDTTPPTDTWRRQPTHPRSCCV